MSSSSLQKMNKQSEYKLIKNEMEQRMTRSNSFVNSLQFRGLNIVRQDSTDNPNKQKKKIIQNMYMDEVNKQLQNVYIKQELLNNKGYGKKKRVFKPRCNYRSEFCEVADKISNQSHNISSTKWVFQNSFQQEKQKHIDKEPLIRSLITQKIKQDNWEQEELKKYKKQKQELQVETIIDEDEDKYNVIKILQNKDNNDDDEEQEIEQKQVVYSDEQKKEGLLVLIGLIKKVEETHPKQYVHRLIEKIMKINSDFLQQIAGSYKQYQQDGFDLYKWLVLNYKFDMTSVYNKQFTEQFDQLNQKQYELNNECKNNKTHNEVPQKGLTMVNESTMKGEIIDPNVIYERIKKGYQFIDKQPMFLKKSKYTSDYRKQKQGIMKFKGSYQKSILEGLELSKCTSYKKHYQDQHHMDNGSRYESKVDCLSPMKSTMPLDDKTIQKSHFIRHKQPTNTRMQKWSLDNLELLQHNNYLNQYQTVTKRDYQIHNLEID